MNKLESELFDLEESLMKNDGMADGSTYSTIVGIANEVSELESENTKLRELVRLMVRRHTLTRTCMDIPCGECPAKDECDQEDALMRELGVEVDG